MTSSGDLHVDSYDFAPLDLTLEQVHVYVRHGERTPVRARLKEFVPEYWNLCHLASTFYVTAQQSNQASKYQKMLERFDGSRKSGDCMLGELTDLGRQSTLDFGKALRGLYSDRIIRLGFLPDTAEENGVTYFRSTNMPRTMESLQQIVQGLYPPNKRGGNYIPQVYVRQGHDEDLIGNMMSCDRLRQLDKQFGAAVAQQLNPSLAELDKKWSKYIEGHPVRLDGRPRASGLLDTILAAKTHGVPLPPDLEDPVAFKLVEDAVIQEWFTGYEDPEFRKLGMGRLLNTLQSKMAQKAKLGPSDPLKLAVMSCHDTSLAGLCTTLDVFDGRWPAFTSSVTFELFSKQGAPSRFAPVVRRQPAEYYVRLRYQNKTLPLPFCSAANDHLEGHPEFCTFNAFQRRVAELTPKDWWKECMVKDGQAG